MKTLKLACPHCEQHLEIRADEERRDLICPGCEQSFNPYAARKAREEAWAKEFVSRPKEPERALDVLRRESAYPQLRSFITLLHFGGTGLALIVGAICLLSWFSQRMSLHAEENGWFFIWGIALLIFAGLWWKLFKPLASLLVDMADAAITNRR